MNRTNNVLLISDNGVKFEGFNSIDTEATICFYPGSVVIMSKYPDTKLDCHYCVKLGANKELNDLELVSRLRRRGILDTVYFIENNGVYYDMDLHGSVD